MDNKDFFNERDKQRDECKKHTSCDGCGNNGICLLMASSPVSIFNYARHDIKNKINLVKESNDKYFSTHPTDDPYLIGLHNGIESVIALFENRMAVHKVHVKPLSLWDKFINFFAKEKI